ncbi:pentapeptide repeat-containing protein [Metallumcola ferriviriculae]|uniref:Pentapeptide repeat-containing protein n=1 Tax=Metallumcola ferriviriculae TaxID=3039180 RepID=A0AAU0UMT3_9FIRM|nr:pentapeptide repeat-containing protein [Desulfitibacteraceae bacterium MK1]
MQEKLMKYLDGVFAPYKDLYAVKELKEELYVDLQERLNDFRNQGYDDEAAYSMTIDSIGDIDEILESIIDKTRDAGPSEKKSDKGTIRESITDKIKGLRQTVKRDMSMSNLQGSDLKGVKVQDGKFNCSSLNGSDFSGSDLTNSSFKYSDLRNAIFDGADLTGAKIIASALKDASFKNCVLNNTVFNSSDLSGVCFDDQTLIGTVFKNTGLAGTSFKNAILRDVIFKTDVKKTVFDGATMDKLTYALLKGSNANLTNVMVI